jgi:hypothetical protein
MAVCKDLNDYGQFKEQFTKLLWHPAQQFRARYSIYQDNYERTADVTISAHFLGYAILASDGCLEIDPTDALAGHFLILVQHPSLSSGIKAAKYALSLEEVRTSGDMRT